MTKALAYFLIAVGLLMGTLVVLDYQAGEVTIGGGRSSLPQVVKRSENAKQFRDAIAYKAVAAAAWGAAGLFLLWLLDRQDRLDPMSPRFKGQSSLDELAEELAKKEREKRGGS